ncbi:FISUMP domain-containing protein [Fibrobacter sp. UBA4309]|uniref:FISUMP domain-containing protein n=1 Tax=Fibrobacter sp. UBA4309 TaxID=1946537 RepID=UPI0025BF7F4C|nr:FISUMP domain-containing protein [Fibrobacter sp. UBA4309]
MNYIYKTLFLAAMLAFVACDDSSSASGEDDSCTEAAAVACPATLEPNTICDARDGKVYKVTTIGTQTWMAENLNYFSCKIKNGSWCYDGKESNCDTYGRLYTWTAAMNIDDSFLKSYANLSGTQRGNCPDGFHVPGDDEWQALYDVGVLDGADDMGFGVLYSGRYYFNKFVDMGREAYFWTSKEDKSEFGGPRNVEIWTVSETFGVGGGSVFKEDGQSVRCVKD